jgi:hypothetical protein
MTSKVKLLMVTTILSIAFFAVIAAPTILPSNDTPTKYLYQSSEGNNPSSTLVGDPMPGGGTPKSNQTIGE